MLLHIDGKCDRSHGSPHNLSYVCSLVMQYNFKQPNLASWNSFVPKPKHIQFTVTKRQRNASILLSEKLEPANIWLFCFTITNYCLNMKIVNFSDWIKLGCVKLWQKLKPCPLISLGLPHCECCWSSDLSCSSLSSLSTALVCDHIPAELMTVSWSEVCR